MFLLLFSLLWLPNELAYHDKDSGLKIQFPEGWELQTDLPEKTAHFRGNHPQQRWICTGTEYDQPWHRVMNLKFFVQSIGARAEKYQVLAAERVSSDRYNAISVKFQMEMGGSRILYRVFSLGRGEHSLLLVFGSKAENWELLEKDIDSILKTVAFEGATQDIQGASLQPDLKPLKVMTNPEGMAATGQLLELLDKERVDLAEVEKLVAAGADVNGMNKAGTTLSIAVRHDHRKVVLWLLDHGADLDHPGNKHTVLLIQASLPVRMLLNARLDAKIEAAAKASGKTMDLEKAETRPVSSPLQPENVNQTSLLLAAITSGDLEGAKKALANGADPTEKHPQMGVDSNLLVHQLIKELDALELDTEGWRALEIAMKADEQSN